MSQFLHGRGFAPEVMRERMKHLQHEFQVFITHARELMQEDPSAKYAIVKGDSITPWETAGDGFRYANLTFGIEPFLCQELSERGLIAALAMFPEFQTADNSIQPKCPPSTTPSATTVASSESVLA